MHILETLREATAGVEGDEVEERKEEVVGGEGEGEDGGGEVLVDVMEGGNASAAQQAFYTADVGVMSSYPCRAICATSADWLINAARAYSIQRGTSLNMY
jgi:hypothetical protein